MIRILPAFIMTVIIWNGVNAQTGKKEKIAWNLGMQAYTFHQFTFVETLDKLQLLGIKYVEVYFGQKLGDGFEGEMNYTLNADTRKKILNLARQKGIQIVACGVVICETHEEWDQLFGFAKAMGIKTITSEPSLKDLDYVGQLADKFNIDVAIHNHPKPSVYWDPGLLTQAIDGKSKHYGSCADIGHWKRMGIDPVEALKMCSGKVKMLHFKDIEKDNADAHDVILGTGVCNVEGVLKELKQSNFKGVLSIEYEYNSENPVPDLKAFIANYNKILAELK